MVAPVSYSVNIHGKRDSTCVCIGVSKNGPRKGSKRTNEEHDCEEDRKKSVNEFFVQQASGAGVIVVDGAK